ncbi:MAG: DUF6755 family protein [Thermomicrobiales bacterium]
MRILRRLPIQSEDSENRPRPGESALVTLGLVIGILFMTIQLWLLTVAFDLYLAGQRGETVRAAVISGLVFVGGLLMLRVLDRRPPRQG